MILFTPIKTLFSIGPVSLSTHGTFIMIGILVAYFFARKTVERRGLSIAAMDDITIVLIIGGIIGARFLYVLLHFPYYIDNPIAILKIWEGGLVSFGGILGGFLAGTFYLKLKKLNFWYYADAIAPYFLLGQGIGRLGDLFAWEEIGTKTDLPWGVIVGNDVPRHPSKLYVFVILITAFFLIRRYQKKHPEKYAGYFLFFSSAVYFVQRFFIEFVNDYPAETAVIDYRLFAQGICILMLVITTFCAWQKKLKVEKRQT